MEHRTKSSYRSFFGETDLFRNKSFGALTEFDHQLVAPTPKRNGLLNLRLSGTVSPVPEGRCGLTQSMPDQAFFSNEVAVELLAILAKTDSATATPTSCHSPSSEMSADSVTRTANPMVRNASFDFQSMPPSKHRRQVELSKQVVAKVHAKTSALLRKSRSMSWPAVRRSPSADGTMLPPVGGASVAVGGGVY